jgi:hypothetical protein
MKSTLTDPVRKCAVCGTFYPGDARELAESIDSLVRDVPPRDKGTVRGIVAPHAGYTYSGATAAAAYGTLRGSSFATVVIVSPSHHEYFEGVSIFDGDAYATPLGVVPIDADARKALLEYSSVIHASREGHGAEHAVEVHLPFLQRMVGTFSLLPLVIGHPTRATCLALAETLGGALKGCPLLFVASSDLSHFYPATVAHQLDRVALDDLIDFDALALMSHLEEGKTEACGGGPIVAVLTALKKLGASRVDVVGYATSGDVTGDDRSVVGYASAVVS